MTGMQSFIFGGNTPWTYEELQRQKAIADSLRQANMATPRNVGEGLAAVGRALGARRREKRAGTREEELQAEMQAQIAAALGGGGYGGGMSGISTPGISATGLGADPNSPQGIADDTMAALGRPAVNDTSMRIKAGLIARGLPEHVADAFVVNFQDESGLNAGINEAAPMVPGSRGGFGLAQWTGPRRVALERFAAQRGVPASDENVQLDFLMQELQGPEAAAGGAIMAAPDRASAADAILRQFLRPAPENVAKRSAQYTGAQPTGGMTAEIASLLSNPMLPPEIRNLLVAQATPQAPMSEREQIELAQAQLDLEQDRAGGQAGATEYGLTPQYATDADGNIVLVQLSKDGMAKQTVLPDGLALQKGLEKLDLGTNWQWYNTLTGEAVGAPIPKNVGAVAAETARGKEVGAYEGAATVAAPVDIATADTTLGYIQELRDHPGLEIGTGMSSVGNFIPGTSGYDFQNRLDQLLSGGFLTAIDQLRGMGSLSNAEGQTATRAISRMDAATSTPEFLDALSDYETIVTTGRERAKARLSSAPKAAEVTAASIATMSRDEFNAWFAGVDVMSLPSDVLEAAAARLEQ